MTKVLLIGGAGFIGLRIANSLLTSRKNYNITIVDNFFRGKADSELLKIESQGVKVINGDCTDPQTFALLEADYDQVYMLASVVGVEYTHTIPNEIIRINTFLILNTLEWLKSSKCRKVLFTSTSECYAGTIEAFNYRIPTPESVPLCIEDISNPRFTYAVTKMLGESGFLNYSRVFGFDCVVVRYHNVYGERMGFKHVIPQVVQRFANNETPFKVYGFDQTRSFCYIDDAVEGTILAMETANTNGEIFHIGNQEEEINIEDLVRYIGSMLGYRGDYIRAGAPVGSVSRRCPDTSKAKQQLGFRSRVGYKEGVKKTVEWYKEYFAKGQPVYE